MDIELLKKSIEDVEKSVETSRKNKDTAIQHILEGELILKAFRDELVRLEKKAAK